MSYRPYEKIQGEDWQESVISRSLSTPPVSPSQSDRYIVGPAPTGDWSIHVNQIAEWRGAVWYFFPLNEGQATWVEDEDVFVRYDGSIWDIFGAGGGGGGLSNVVEDLTPQLGGPLDVNGQNIVSVTNGDINLIPNGTGRVGIGVALPAGGLHIDLGTDADLTDPGIRLANNKVLVFEDNTDAVTNPGFIWYDDFHYMYIGTTNNTAITIDDTRKVGIGLASNIRGVLHVRSGVSGAAIPSVDADDLVIESAGNGGVTFLAGSASASGIHFGDSVSNIAGSIIYDHNTDALKIGTATVERLQIASDGGLVMTGATGGSQGAGTINATQLYVNGVVVGGGTGYWTQTGSDIYYTTGKVGIGAIPTDGTLHVQSATAGTVAASVNADELVLESGGNGGMHILTPDANSGFIMLGSPTTSVGSYISWSKTSNQLLLSTVEAAGYVSIAAGAETEVLRLQTTGLYTNGATGGAQGSGTINATGVYVNGVAIGGGSQWVTSGSDIYYNTGNVSIGTATNRQALTLEGVMAIGYANAPTAFLTGSTDVHIYASEATGGAGPYINGDFVDTMTSNTTPSPFLILANGNDGAGWPEWHAFNDNTADFGWASDQGLAFPHWLVVVLDQTRIATKYRFFPYVNTSWDTNSFNFYGTNDVITDVTSANAATWTLLDAQTGQTPSNSVWTGYYSFANSTAYKAYKFEVTSGGTKGTQILEFEISADAATGPFGARGNLILQSEDDNTNGIYMVTGATPAVRMSIDGTGNVGIGTDMPSQLLDINDDSIRIRTAKTPATASDTGTQGQIAWDSNYIYVCTATNTWVRAAITTW